MPQRESSLGTTRKPEFAHASGGTANGAGRDAPQLRVNVLATTETRTIAALRTAADLAASLGAQITLIAIEVVPWQLPLQRPPVPVAFLERKLYRLVCEAGIVGEEVRIQLCLCRDQRDTLRKVVRPHSLVVIGGQNRWWLRRERNLGKFLSGLGHQVIFAGTAPRTRFQRQAH
jgi:nucleotide-binding universal stress UspA family protein